MEKSQQIKLDNKKKGSTDDVNITNCSTLSPSVCRLLGPVINERLNLFLLRISVWANGPQEEDFFFFFLNKTIENFAPSVLEVARSCHKKY